MIEKKLKMIYENKYNLIKDFGAKIFYCIFTPMLKAYKYKLSLTKKQADFMNQSLGCARVVYNYCLQRRIEFYQAEKKGISQFDLCKEIVRLKRNENYTWLAEVDHQSLCCSVQNLDKAFTKFFREKKGFPKFKSKKHPNQSCQFTQGVQIDFKNKKIRFPKIGWCKLHLSREFEGKIKTTTVSRNAAGMYFVSILIDNALELPKKSEIKKSTAIGIDVGIKHFATLSDGTRVDNPKHYEKSQKRLAILSRRLSKKEPGSKNYEKAKLKVAKHHYKISCKRSDFLHKLSTKIVRENQTVIIEDLNVAGMVKNHCLAKSISSVSWSEFFRQLQYKCEWSGRNLVKIGRFEPSSKICTCGVINKELSLKDRVWTCASCGVTHDRDLLAANNIKGFGLVPQNLLSKSG